MKSIIFASMLVMYVSSIYPMKPQKKSESQITFETYQLLETLPIDVNKTIWKKVIDRFQGTLLNEDTFLLFEPKAVFTPEEHALRYPWKFKTGLFGAKVHYSNGSQSFKVASEKLIVTGPNNNNICIVDNKRIKVDDFSKSGFIGFVKGLIDTSESLPVIPSNIHPNKNECVVASPIISHIDEELDLASGWSALFLYNLDTLEMSKLPEIRIYDHAPSSDVLFGAGDTLLVLVRGVLVIYSLNEKQISGIISSDRYVSRSEFEDDSKSKIKDFYKKKGCIKNFHYSFDYPGFILFGIDDKTYGIFNIQNKQVNLCEEAISVNGHACLQPRWGTSMKDYSSCSFYFFKPLNNRDAVSLISWDVDNLKAYFLTFAAHNWLNSAKKSKQEARSILSTLYHSQYKWKLLLKSTELNLRINPFKDIFYAIKKTKHRHVTEVI